MSGEKKKGISRSRIPFKRKCVQLYAALLVNCNIRGFITGRIYTGKAKNICVPGLNCYSCPGAVGACPLGSLQNALGAQDHTAFFYVLGILGLFGLLLGRTICGWLCPVGLIQELIHKIPTPKIGRSRITRALSWLKYVILAGTAVLIPLLAGDPGFCKYICPAGIFEGAFGLLLNGTNAELLTLPRELFTNKLIILFILFLLCVFIFRAFCRFICPLGALYSFFNRISPVGVRVDREKCTGCGVCVTKCRMDVRRVGDRECINCGECIDVCAAGAISLKAGKIVLMANEGRTANCRAREGAEAKTDDKQAGGCRGGMKKRSLIAWGIALLILAGAAVYFNFLDPSIERGGGDPSVIIEKADAPGFAIQQMDGEQFALQEHRGQVVVINYWATWCVPCCRELPYFDRLQRELGDDVYVLCIHHSMETDDVAAFIAREGLPPELHYARDTDDAVWDMYGTENTVLPRTVIIDREGKIIYAETDSVTYEELLSLVSPALR